MNLVESDILPVEVGGQEIGDCFVSEITDEYVEVVFLGHTFKISPHVHEHFEMRRDLGRYYG